MPNFEMDQRPISSFNSGPANSVVIIKLGTPFSFHLKTREDRKDGERERRPKPLHSFLDILSLYFSLSFQKCITYTAHFHRRKQVKHALNYFIFDSIWLEFILINFIFEKIFGSKLIVCWITNRVCVKEYLV